MYPYRRHLYPFKTSLYTNFAFHYDPSDLTAGNVTLSGSQVTSVADKTGNGWALANSVGTVTTRTISLFNNLRTLRFGGGVSLGRASGPSFTACHIFMIFQVDSVAPGFQALINWGLYQPDLYLSNAHPYLEFGPSSISGFNYTFVGGVAYLIDFTIDATTKALNNYVNGAADTANTITAPGSPPSSWTGAFCLGADGTSQNGDTMAGDIGETAVATDIKTGNTRTQIRKSFGLKWIPGVDSRGFQPRTRPSRRRLPSYDPPGAWLQRPDGLWEPSMQIWSAGGEVLSNA